jgi:hypothetical protein
MSGDCLLDALRDAKHRRDQATQDMRVLIAYAREVHRPRPYRLADLAETAGMSVSGVRTAYTPADTDRARSLNAAPGTRQGQAESFLALIAHLLYPCPAPPATDHNELCPCGSGFWPCRVTEAAWLARGLDPSTQITREIGENRAIAMAEDRPR